METLQRAWQRADLIVMTGGLGPTEDDLTRESISALLGEVMQVDPEQETTLRARFAHASMPMLERNMKQATLIPSAQSLENPLGSAPGWWVEKDAHIIVAMPGVPREMYRMWEEEVVPRLSKYTSGLIFTRILRVYGLGESSVEELLDPLIHNSNPTVATYAKPDAVDVRVSAKAESFKEASQLVAEMEGHVRQLLGHHVFGIEGDTLASVIGKHLQEQHQTLSVMESLTGGLLASIITDFQSSSKHFVGGIVAYSSDLKAQMGVPRKILDRYGAVSEETACAMAHAVREYFRTDFGIGVTGVAGPDKQEDKPVGTVHIAVKGPKGVVTSMGPGWRGGRVENKRYAVLSALNLLRRYLEGTIIPD